jgi:hypothetical protein
VSGLDRYRGGIDVAYGFWNALADDDEDALAPLLSPIWDGRPDGFAGLYRADRSLAPETCRFLGLATHAELLAPDRVRFRYVITDRILKFEAETQLLAWPLELVEVDGQWFVDQRTELPRLEWIDLAPLFPDLEPSPPGPIQ